jgi:hypothetical protein
VPKVALSSLITAMLRMEIRMSLPEAQYSMTRASDFLFLVDS